MTRRMLARQIYYDPLRRITRYQVLLEVEVTDTERADNQGARTYNRPAPYSASVRVIQEDLNDR